MLRNYRFISRSGIVKTCEILSVRVFIDINVVVSERFIKYIFPRDLLMRFPVHHPGQSLLHRSHPVSRSH